MEDKRRLATDENSYSTAEIATCLSIVPLYGYYVYVAISSTTRHQMNFD